jgi:hypothetical protein
MIFVGLDFINIIYIFQAHVLNLQLHESCHNLYSLLNIVKMVRPRLLRWAGHATRAGGTLTRAIIWNLWEMGCETVRRTVANLGAAQPQAQSSYVLHPRVLLAYDRTD